MLQVKTCSCCKVEKEISEFVKSKNKHDGLSCYCKVCHKAKGSSWGKDNKEKTRAKSTRYRSNNRAIFNELQRNWKNDNRYYCNAQAAKWRASKLQATPSWSNLQLIKDIYQQASHLTLTTGIQHHVDHIIPLQGKTVSGLHVEYNLQILTATENMRKSNKYYYQEAA